MKNTIAQIMIVVLLMVWLWVVTRTRVVYMEDDSMQVTFGGEVVYGTCPDYFAELICSD